MPANKSFIIASAVACAASALVAPSARAQYAPVTKVIQTGLNGYSGELTRAFGSNNTFAGNTTRGNTVGGSSPSASSGIAADGYNGGSPTAPNDSPDQHIFMQFNNVFGTLIPANAFVIDATLTVTTARASNAQTGGYFLVSGVNVPWSTSSTYNTLKPAGSAENGLNWINGTITRPIASFDALPTIYYGGDGSLDQGDVVNANVTTLVRNWASGASPNYGFSINSGTRPTTTDGWQIYAGNTSQLADRPKLSITYTTAPVVTAKFQQGVNGYTGTVMSWMNAVDNSSTDGSSINQAFLDGWQPNPDFESVSSDDHALIKFNNLFQGTGGNIPKTARIVKATLRLTTSDVSNAQTGHVYEAHQLLRDWDTNTTWTDFSVQDGIREGIDEGGVLSANYDMDINSQSYFDITSAVDAWRTGKPNYGIDVRATRPTPTWADTNGTSDGWSIYFTGALDPTLRPELSISYILRAPGDANENGKIDADDFALTDRGFNRHLNGWENGDFNVDGVVDAADYLLLDSAWAAQGGHPLDPGFLAAREAQFGADYAAALVAAVPEPSSLAACGLAALPLLRRRRK